MERYIVIITNSIKQQCVRRLLYVEYERMRSLKLAVEQYDKTKKSYSRIGVLKCVSEISLANSRPC